MASSDYNLPKIPGVVSMTKVKNALRSARPDLVTKISNIRVNGQLQGCSGFITNPATERVVYILTDVNGGTVHDALYREARNDHDYIGGRNQFCSPAEIVECALELLDLLDSVPVRI